MTLPRLYMHFVVVVESIAPFRPHFLFCVIMVLQACSIQIAEEVTEENDYGSIYKPKCLQSALLE